MKEISIENNMNIYHKKGNLGYLQNGRSLQNNAKVLINIIPSSGFGISVSEMQKY
jgi:hypothetical protein